MEDILVIKDMNKGTSPVLQIIQIYTHISHERRHTTIKKHYSTKHLEPSPFQSERHHIKSFSSNVVLFVRKKGGGKRNDRWKKLFDRRLHLPSQFLSLDMCAYLSKKKLHQLSYHCFLHFSCAFKLRSDRLMITLWRNLALFVLSAWFQTLQAEPRPAN